ncbi:hypothetical protein EVAR_41141_1 [Eumeta japonica]|uniref:Uncharacterized protein n=1 Tax=Eumeta variegata TaxID=151549 RepID=A0A4C1YF03_EUMVA|nr:hypothetical protein EVAR_41141_1 [Eumeta japonica]
MNLTKGIKELWSWHVGGLLKKNSPEAFYNKRHMTARNTMEWAIGLFKRPSQIFISPFWHYHPDVVARMVIACRVLDNICNRAGIPALTEAEEEKETRIISAVQAKYRFTA